MNISNAFDLADDERMLQRARMSIWEELPVGLIVVLVAFELFALAYGMYEFTLLLAVPILLLVLNAYLVAKSSILILTDKRLFVRSGWLKRLTVERRVQSLTEVSCNEDISGSVFSYGTLLIGVRDGHDILVRGVKGALRVTEVLNASIARSSEPSK